MCSAQVDRYEWAKAILKSPNLNSTAKSLASAMSLEWANEETDVVFPSLDTMAEYLKMSKDSIKRAIRALVDAGWMSRTEGRGSGNMTRYTRLSPGQVIPLPRTERATKMPPIKGRNGALSENSKGADLREKGGNPSTSYIMQEHTNNIGRPDTDRFANHRFTGNAFDGPVLVRDKDHGNLSAWGRWLIAEGFPPLSAIPVRRHGSAKNGGDLFALPWRTPPTDARGIEEATSYFIAVMEAQQARHAAQ